MNAHTPTYRNGAPDPASRLGVVVSGFPRISETFILNELRQLQELGLWLRIFALKPGQQEIVHPTARLLQSHTVYVPVKLTSSLVLGALRAGFRWAVRGPGRFLRILTEFWRSGKKEREFPRWKSLLRWLWLCDRIEGERLEKIHAHFAHDPATLAYWVYRLLEVPYSFTAHAKDIYCYSQEQLKEKLRAARFVATCTRFNGEYLQKLSPNGTPIYCLYHGLDPEHLRPVAQPKAAPPLILSVGRLVEKKGFSDLIQACALLEQRGVAFQCQIVGEGPLRQTLEAQIQAGHLEHRITLRGALGHDRLLPLYHQASVFALPCCVTATGDRDGIPNVILEAMALELPVVSTRVSGIPEAVEHAHNGLLVEQHHPEALADAIQLLLQVPEMARQFGKEGRRIILDKFNLHRNVNALKELLI